MCLNQTWIQTGLFFWKSWLTNMSHSDVLGLPFSGLAIENNVFFMFKILTRYQLLEKFKIRILTLYSSLFFKIRSSVSIIYLSNITTRHREAPNYRFKQTLVSSKHCLIHQCYIASHSQSWYDVEWRSIESVTK